ncbi:MAG: DoxX family membrane protein [Gemmatimonas sp.]|nr:DoxX family membrane protein [Gemmatimonas sp.]
MTEDPTADDVPVSGRPVASVTRRASRAAGPSSAETLAPSATILIRLMVGAVFLSEGIQKFLYPESVGAGRFADIGFPNPELLSQFVGSVEIVCGSLVVVGLFTRAAVIPLVAIMLVAIVTTKVPILLATDVGPFQVRQLSRYGPWSMAHESRTDFSMLMGSLFLLFVGAGRLSLDALRR